AATKRYVAYGERETEPGKSTVEDRMLTDTLPPRAYAVALRSGFSDIATLEEALIAATTEHRAHVHGLAVIDQDWFFKQHAYRTPHEFYATKGRALAAFSSAVLRGIQSFNMMPAAMDRYLGQADDKQLPRDTGGRLLDWPVNGRDGLGGR